MFCSKPCSRWVLLGLIGMILNTVVFAAGIDLANKYAWAENAGWLNWRDTVNNYGSTQVFADHLEGYIWAENIGWIRLGTHTAGGTHTYANTSQGDYGVNRNVNTLSGYAWAENAGWINFNPTSGGVTLNATTGEFDGYAWGENIGWIRLRSTTAPNYGVTVLTGSAVALTSSLNPSTVGQSVTFTATVAGTPTPTGTVNFTADGIAITDCTAKALTSGAATCATAGLTVGSRVIAAAYSGDGNYSTSTGNLTQTVNGGGGGGGGDGGETPINGVCGSANGQTFSSTPTSGFCATGTASALSGIGPWNWSCSGLNGGATANCSAAISAITPLLTVTKTGSGTVSSVPAGIACGSDCSENYPVNTPVTLTATAASGYSFSGWGGGCAGTAPTCTLTLSANQTVTATFSSLAPPSASIGVLRNGQWYLDRSGNSAWDQCGSDGCDAFGQAGDMPVVGNWDGGDRSLLGVLRSGTAQWFLDRNGNGQWDGCDADPCLTFGDIGDLPVAADWSGDGKAKIGVFRAGNWYLDANGNGRWDGCGIDRCYLKVLDQSAPGFGLNGDLPIAGDWNGDGIAKVGVFRAGNWYFDNGNGQWDGCGIDRCYLKNPDQPNAGFGLAGDYPIAGDWSGNGVIKIGVFRNGSWFFDNGNGAWDGCGIDTCILRIPEQPNSGFGLPGDLPAVGRW